LGVASASGVIGSEPASRDDEVGFARLAARVIHTWLIKNPTMPEEVAMLNAGEDTNSHF
jgi:hypothetical protein